MKTLQKFLQRLYDDKITKDFDRLIPVIGDEGMGKSTLMLELCWLWYGITDAREQTVDEVINSIAWDLEDFETHLSSAPQQSCIIVHDAARVMSKKKAMHGSQIEIEEDLLDARFGNYLMLLGYQEFDLVPTVLANRRAKNALRVVKRGWVHGHNESAIRRRYENDKWPDPALRDTFPDLEGKRLWREFVEEDQMRKKERIAPDDDEDEEEQLSVPELADRIEEKGVDPVVSIHGGHNKPYIDPDLIEIEYGTSGNKAKKVAKLLKKRVDVSGMTV